MADEEQNPFADPTPEETGEGQPEEGQSETPEEKVPDIPIELQGTQFKTYADLVSGYKNLQGQFTKVSQEHKGFKEKVPGLIRDLIRQNQPTQQPKAKPTKEEFFNALMEKGQDHIEAVVGPLIAQAIQEMEGRLGQYIAPLSEYVGGSQKDAEVGRLTEAFPSITQEEEQAVLEVLANDPKMNAHPNRLFYAYAEVNPAAYSQWLTTRNQPKADPALNNIKAVAGVGGKTTSTKQAAEEKDEWDIAFEKYGRKSRQFS